jgi:chromosome segregation ATPase
VIDWPRRAADHDGMDNDHRIAAVEAGLEAVKGELSVVKASFATRDALAHLSDRVTVLESTSIIPREFHEMSRRVAVIESNYVTRDYLDEKLAENNEKLNEKLDEKLDRVATALHALSQHVVHIESHYVTRDYLDEKLHAVDGAIARLSADVQALSQRVSYIETAYATKHDLEVAIRGLTWRMYGVVTASIVANYVIVRLLLP